MPAIAVLLVLTSLAHIPTFLLPGTFDRNAAPQFVVLVVTATVAAVVIAKNRIIKLPRHIAFALAALLTSSFVSFILSDSYKTSLVGDTGRYSGLISLWSFILVALAFTFLQAEKESTLWISVAVASISVTALGFLQSFGFITLPTGGGVGSTLGNLDFLSAWIGTTSLLVFVALRKLKISNYFFFAYVVAAIVTLYKIDAKQGFLDLAIVALLSIAYLVLQRSRAKKLTPLAWKAIATFGILLWSEIIYLVPMAKLPIPFIGDDVNVQIRSDFWYSAAHMFFNHLGFGVGPDNFGSYYEKYRSLSSVRNFEFVVANDAHSSMLQSFATLGIFATLAFLILILFVIYAFIDLTFLTKSKKYPLLLIAFIAFYTNALISPITLPNKLIFWAIAGYVIGDLMRIKSEEEQTVNSIRALPISLVSVVAIVLPTLLFTHAFVQLSIGLDEAKNKNVTHYVVSTDLPCVLFANAQLNLAQTVGNNTVKDAQKIIRDYPRCLDPLGYLAKSALEAKDYDHARPLIYQLLDVAPARNNVVNLAAQYAVATNDKPLIALLTSQGIKLGLDK